MVAHITVSGIDAYYQMLKDNGVEMLHGIGDQPWGYRVFYVRDPDGYEFCFCEPLAA